MVREDILGGLKNALERGESMQDAKASLISAGYSQAEVEEALATLEKVQVKRKEIPIPTITTVSLEQPPTPPAAHALVKPFPQIKVKRRFNYWLLIPIILVSFAIAYLIYNILLAQ